MRVMNEAKHTKEQAEQIIAGWEKELESAINNACEKAYWQFDARRKGYAEWEGMPQSERDAFKAECYMIGKRYILEPEHDVSQTLANDLMEADQHISDLERQLSQENKLLSLAKLRIARLEILLGKKTDDFERQLSIGKLSITALNTTVRELARQLSEAQAEIEHLQDVMSIKQVVVLPVDEYEIKWRQDGSFCECPCCGSLDIGGAIDICHCYVCGLSIQVKGAPLQEAMNKWNTRKGKFLKFRPTPMEPHHEQR